jgi:hypothetical protein
MRNKIILWAVILMISVLAFASGNEPIDIVRDFYKKYFEYLHTKKRNSPSPRIKLSEQFQKSVDKNSYVCENYASGVCGWQADGDAYLDAQEIDPNLTFTNSGITFTSIEKGIVEVKLNVYPSEKADKKYYLREIKYKMILEKGAWVIDDIIYKDSGSSRKAFEKETAEYLANPDQDSKAMKRKKRVPE